MYSLYSKSHQQNMLSLTQYNLWDHIVRYFVQPVYRINEEMQIRAYEQHSVNEMSSWCIIVHSIFYDKCVTDVKSSASGPQSKSKRVPWWLTIPSCLIKSHHEIYTKKLLQWTASKLVHVTVHGNIYRIVRRWLFCFLVLAKCPLKSCDYQANLRTAALSAISLIWFE